MKNFSKYLAVLGFCFLFSSTTFAATVSEIEPNDTSTQAQTVERNNPHPELVISGNQTGQYVAKGTISDTSDTDWYKVYLPANSQTVLSLNGKSGNKFEVFSQDFSLLKQVNFLKDPNFIGAFPHYVSIPSSGYYYVKVSTYAAGGSYLFTIGEPNYTVSSYTYTASNPLTLTSSITSVEGKYNLRNITSVPEKAIVYEVSIYGTKSGSVSSESRKIKLNRDYSWFTTSPYSWNVKIPVSANKLLRSEWDVKLEGSVYSSSKPYTLIPEIRFTYVYPILP